MGVSGSGKTTVGQMLAKQLEIPFFDADDFHPEANIQKMKSGQALNDEDRQPWLERLALIAQDEVQKKGAVITCSALKAIYRQILQEKIEKHTSWVFLNGSIEVIHERMKKRKGHFMPLALLQSQFDTLEKPKDVITISILEPLDKIITTIIEAEKT